MLKSSGCGFSGCIGTAFTCDWRLNYNSWAMWPSTIWRFGYLSVMEFTIVMSLCSCRYCLVGYKRIRGYKNRRSLLRVVLFDLTMVELSLNCRCY